MNMIDYLLFDRTFALIFYGALITVASGIGIACGKVCKQEMVMWMAFSWIGDNWLFLQVPIDRAAVAMTVFNALLTLPMAAIAIRYKCRTSADIVGLYVLRFGVVLLAVANGAATSPLLFGVLNLIFVARLLLVGITGGMEISRRISRSDFVLHRRRSVPL